MKWKVLAVVFFSLLTLGYFLLPEPKMPVPDGKHLVGVTQFEVAKGEKWVQITAWYPGVESEGKAKYPYMTQWIGKELAAVQGLPEVLFSDTYDSFSFVDLVPVEGEHPVLIFNHGYGSYPRQNMSQFEYLASHGYIVLALGHPGDSLVLKRAGGELVKQLSEAEVAFPGQEEMAERGNRIDKLSQAQDRNQWQKLIVELQSLPMMLPTSRRFAHWHENNMLLVDQLARIQAGELDTLLKGRLDLAKLGAFGHSFGGAISVEIANNRPEIKTAVNLDGPQFNMQPEKALTTPVCFIYGDHTDITFSSFPQINDALLSGSETKCSLTFKGAGHNNFTDLTYNPYVKYMGITGEVDGERMGKVLNKTILDYFNWQLFGEQKFQPEGQLIQINHLQG